MVDISFQARINSPLLASVQILENQGIVTGDAFTPEATDDPDTGDDDDPTITPLNASALLEASKSDTLFIDADGNGLPSPGDTLLYEVNVTNLGNSSASNVVFTDIVDPNTTIIPGTVQTSQGTVATGNIAGESTIKIVVGSIPGNNGKVTISFRVTINNSVAAGVTAISNQGSVEADGIAPFNTSDPDGDGATITSIQAIANLSVTKEDFLLLDNDKNLDPGLEGPSAGDTLLYVITIANSGNSAATNVVVTDTPDPNTTLIPGTVQASIGTISTGNGTDDTAILVSIDSIPGGGSATVGFSVKINEDASVAALSNQASITADGVSGASGLISTDPGTEQVNDATITTLSTKPTALSTIAEPMNMQFSSFLPITVR